MSSSTGEVQRERSDAHPFLTAALRCYQCKKCSSGCPLSFAMDVLPHQIMRLVQLDSPQEILVANTHWICSSCQTCTTRCPNDIDIAGVMDVFRQQSVDNGTVSEKEPALFNRLFLSTVKRHGRVHELAVIGKFKLLSGQWLNDIPMGLGMLLRGKLRIFPNRIRGRHEIRNLFKKRTRV